MTLILAKLGSAPIIIYKVTSCNTVVSFFGLPCILYRVAQKFDTFCFVRPNFIKYWPIFKFISLL